MLAGKLKMGSENLGQETFEPNESPGSAPAVIENSSQGSEEIEADQR